MLKKSFVVLLVLLLAVTTLAGCGQKPAEEGGEQPQPE